MLIGQDIAVIGAGVAGLALSRALALRGARVTVYEQAGSIAEVGAGVQIAPNGAVVLEALGLDPAGRATRLCAARLLDGYSGREVLTLDFARFRPDAGFWLFHRADLIEMLAEGARVAGVEIRLGTTVAAIDETGEGTRLRVGAEDEDVAHDLVLGADGLHSVVRAHVDGRRAPFFTGQVAWRALIPGASSLPPEAVVHLGRGRHVVSYPLRGGQLVNIVAVEEQADWAGEGWNHAGDPDRMRAAFAPMGEGVRALLGQVETVMRWGLFRHEVAGHWYSGRCAILGDAAHPTLPFLAQGANLALEDAFVLADCLARLPHDEALPLYQARRAARVRRVIAAANANARNYHLSGPARLVGHAALRLGGRFAPGRAVGQFGWLYDHDVTRG